MTIVWFVGSLRLSLLWFEEFMGLGLCQISAVRSKGSCLRLSHACFLESFRSIGEACCPLALCWAVEQPVEDLQRPDSNPCSFQWQDQDLDLPTFLCSGLCVASVMVCDFLSEVVKESVDPYLQMLTLRGLSDGATNNRADWLGCGYLHYSPRVNY